MDLHPADTALVVTFAHVSERCKGVPRGHIRMNHEKQTARTEARMVTKRGAMGAS